MIIAYLRIGLAREDLEDQKDEIKRFVSEKGIEVDKWVTEIADSKRTDRETNLSMVLDRFQKGDTLIVSDIARLSRTISELMVILSRCMNKEVRVYCIKDRYILDETLNCKTIAHALDLVADVEHHLMSIRTKEALAHKKANGGQLGRPKGTDSKQSFLDENKDEVMDMLNRGESVVAICKHFNVSRNTYYQFKRNYGV